MKAILSLYPWPSKPHALFHNTPSKFFVSMLCLPGPPLPERRHSQAAALQEVSGSWRISQTGCHLCFEEICVCPGSFFKQRRRRRTMSPVILWSRAWNVLQLYLQQVPQALDQPSLSISWSTQMQAVTKQALEEVERDLAQRSWQPRGWDRPPPQWQQREGQGSMPTTSCSLKTASISAVLKRKACILQTTGNSIWNLLVYTVLHLQESVLQEHAQLTQGINQ